MTGDPVLGERIRVLRRRANMSQRELAEAAGLKRNSICNIEAGRQQLSLDAAKRVAPALKVTMAELYGLDGTAPLLEASLDVLFKQLTVLTRSIDLLANESSRALKEVARLEALVHALKD